MKTNIKYFFISLIVPFLLWSCATSSITSSASNAKSLSLWQDESPAKNLLLDYIASVTKKGSPDFIPEEDRIAVFDLDGTLFCETDPIYFEWILYTHRVLEDADYKGKATDEQLALAHELAEVMVTRAVSDEIEKQHSILNSQVYAGMSLEEFQDYVRSFMEAESLSYPGMKRGEAFYRPMLQVVDLLLEYDFTLYICSGTDRILVRTLVEDTIPIPPSQVIGTDNTIVAKGQGTTDGLDYVYTPTDNLVMGGQLLTKNIKMNKVSVIAQEIGQKPVLSFGNSFGDASMANYVISDNSYPAAAFMLLCDDTVRESGNLDKASAMEAACAENGWHPISMAKDWKTIYGEECFIY